MKIFVYNYREDEAPYFEKFSKEYGVEIGYTTEYPSLENAELVKGYDGLSVIVSDMNAAILEKFHEYGIKSIATRSIGFEHFDLGKAKELGIKISNVSYSPDSVANYAIMLMLMCCRKAKYLLQASSTQDYSLPGKMGKEISNCTVGIMGTGRIGATVIRHLAGFGCRIIAYDPYPNKEMEKVATYVSSEEIVKEADIISFHVPATAENYHFVNEETIGKMKDGVILVNTARGSLIDTEALIRGVEQKKISAVALDVIEEEFGLYYHNLSGQVLDNRNLAILKSFPNVIVTGHTAFYTEQSISDMVEISLKGNVLFDKGEQNPWEIA